MFIGLPTFIKLVLVECLLCMFVFEYTGICHIHIYIYIYVRIYIYIYICVCVYTPVEHSNVCYIGDASSCEHVLSLHRIPLDFFVASFAHAPVSPWNMLESVVVSVW